MCIPYNTKLLSFLVFADQPGTTKIKCCKFKKIPYTDTQYIPMAVGLEPQKLNAANFFKYHILNRSAHGAHNGALLLIQAAL